MDIRALDTIDFMIRFENGNTTDAETVEGMQELINTGLIAGIQGFYERIAKRLIAVGHCKPAGEWSSKEAREHFENKQGEL